jgi:hypothetical protein
VPAETNPGVRTPTVQAHDDLSAHPDAARVATLTWRSAQCSTQSCVEVANLADGGVAIRDSKAGDTSAVLLFSGDEWSAFVTGIKAGDFD